MAHRTFTITLPADTVAHNLYSQMLLVTGAVPVDGILADRVSSLRILATLANNANTVQIFGPGSDTGGQLLVGGDLFQRDSNRNTICLKEYFVKGSAVSLSFTVDIDSI